MAIVILRSTRMTHRAGDGRGSIVENQLLQSAGHGMRRQRRSLHPASMATKHLSKPVNVVWIALRQFGHIEKTMPGIGEPARRLTSVALVL